MKTLFVSDLDGTLLHSDQKTSAFTNQVINTLVEKGVCFSYATARSIHTAKKATAGMEAAFPLIVYNGAFIVDNKTGQVLHSCFFSREEAWEILQTLLAAGVQPIVYGFYGGREQMRYLPEKLHKEARAFLDTRKGDVRDTPVDTEIQLGQGEIFYFTCIDEAARLSLLHEKYRQKYRCVYARDIYAGAQWLEIMPKDATKAQAVGKLKKMLGCDRVVCFGDGVNDGDMFRIADEAYAVENAVPELKAAATAVILGNDEDGVARFLQRRLGREGEWENGQAGLD